MMDRRERIEAEVRDEGFQDPDIIEAEVELRLGLLSKERFDTL